MFYLNTKTAEALGMVFKTRHILLKSKQAEKSQGLQKISSNTEKLNSIYIFLPSKHTFTTRMQFLSTILLPLLLLGLVQAAPLEKHLTHAKLDQFTTTNW